MNLTRFLRQPGLPLVGKAYSRAFHVSPYGQSSASTLAEIKFRPFKSPAKTSSKRPKRGPFVARFFRGEIDESLFEYPELSGEQLTRVKDMAAMVDGVYKSSITSQMQAASKIPDDVLSELKSLGLFGLLVPRLYGGLELGSTEMNYLAEVISQNSAIFHMINFHNIYGVNLLLEAGTEAQKQMFLPKLAAGESTFGVCIWEDNAGSDLLSIRSTAVPLDKDSFLLSGTKIWANNIDNADVLLVLANVSSSITNAEADLTFFLLDKNTPGVVIEPVQKSCIQQLGMYKVTFDNVTVKRSSILGGQGKGFNLANGAILNNRTIMPSAVVQTVKSLLDKAVDHVIHREQFGQPLFNFNLIKWKIAEASMKLYILESMVYMTAGLNDCYEDQDTKVESAITRVFAMDTLQYCLNIFSDIFSSRMIEDMDLSSWRDSHFLNVCEGTKDVTKMHITLSCLRYLSEHEHERVKKLRNPLLYPKEKLMDMFLAIKQSNDNPSITKIISHNVHPSLRSPADMLEYCIYRLQWTSELNVVHSGLEITKNQHVLTGLAEIAIECYAIAAALARASRSYCIGLKNAETELMATHVYTSQQVAKIRQLVEYLDPYNPPVHYNTIHEMAEAVGYSKSYFAEHPTARSYL